MRERARHEGLARELKFGVTDVNGWQTAYGYDSGRSRPIFERSVRALRGVLRDARRRLTNAPERELLRELTDEFASFMALDAVAYRALQDGREEVTKRIFLGPALVRFEAMANTAERLAGYERGQAAVAERAFDDTRDDVRRRLIAVALGAGLVIVLLLVTAWDVARMALERERERRPAGAGE